MPQLGFGIIREDILTTLPYTLIFRRKMNHFTLLLNNILILFSLLIEKVLGIQLNNILHVFLNRSYLITKYLTEGFSFNKLFRSFYYMYYINIYCTVYQTSIFFWIMVSFTIYITCVISDSFLQRKIIQCRNLNGTLLTFFTYS